MAGALSPLKADVLENYANTVEHGFFTRLGGASKGIYATFNISGFKSDAPEDVDYNLLALAGYFNAPRAHVCFLRQVHSATAIFIESPFETGTLPPQGDALVTQTPGLILGVQTADCVPILLYEPSSKMIAAIHGGWRGLVAGIIENTLALMAQKGADASKVQAAIGPSIFEESYEVGSDVHQAFIEASPQNEKYFKVLIEGEKWLLDLRQLAEDRLHRAWVAAITRIEQDTYVNQDLFFSCRRAHHHNDPSFGNQGSCIMLRAA